MDKLCAVIAVCSMLLVNSVQAQTDNSNQNASQKADIGIADSNSKTVTDGFDKEDRVQLQIDQIPDLVRLTLERGKEFRGWHNAVIYLDRASKEYTFHITDSTSATRTFKFDESGNVLKDQTASAKSPGRKSSAKKTK